MVRGQISCSSFEYDFAADAVRKNTPYHHYRHHDDIADKTEFTLSHFREPLFPKTISTFKTKGKHLDIWFGRNNIGI